MIQRSLDFLASKNVNRPGAKCLIGMVFLKDGQPDHPQVQQALETATRFGRGSSEAMLAADTYDPALMVMFLCDYNPDKYRTEIKNIVGSLFQRQMPSGAWTYGGGGSADTSQTQFALLAAWTAFRHGFDLPKSGVQRACDWLLRTQSTNGGFAYNPSDPGNDGERSKQTVYESVSAGGLGSVYICSNLLGINSMVSAADGTVGKIPGEFRRVLGRESGSLDVTLGRGYARRVRQAINDGNAWCRQNYTISPQKYPLYYLYALERFKSFEEALSGQKEAEPRWYNDGVRHLLARQRDDGQFIGQSHAFYSSTCFAVLFLQRSMKKSLNSGQLGEGLLIGGRGLPTDTSRIRMVDGRVVSALERRSAAALAQVLADPESPDFEALADSGDALLINADSVTAEDQAQLRRLAAEGAPHVRRMAIQTLATQRNLAHVPTLIEALSADETEVMVAARDALRQISRKFDGFGLPNAPTEQELAAAIKSWRTWYATYRPANNSVE